MNFHAIQLESMVSNLLSKEQKLSNQALINKQSYYRF